MRVWRLSECSGRFLSRCSRRGLAGILAACRICSGTGLWSSPRSIRAEVDGDKRAAVREGWGADVVDRPTYPRVWGFEALPALRQRAAGYTGGMDDVKILYCTA